LQHFDATLIERKPFQSAARLKKEKNKARDIRLKAESARKNRSLNTRLGPAGKDTQGEQRRIEDEDTDSEEERSKLEERMERAMVAAQEDQGEETEDSDILMEEEENVTVSEESEHDEDEETPVSFNPDYLPDHYFEQSGPKKATETQTPKVVLKQRKRSRKRQGEKIVG